MVKTVIDDMDQFKAYLASQPLCCWAAQKEADIAAGRYSDSRKKSSQTAPKSDNSDLANALASMA